MSFMKPVLPLRAAAARPSVAACRPLRVIGSGVATAIDALPSSAIDARWACPPAVWKSAAAYARAAWKRDAARPNSVPTPRARH